MLATNPSTNLNLNTNLKKDLLLSSATLIEDHITKDRFPDLYELLQGSMMLQNQALSPLDTGKAWNFIKPESFRNLPDFMLSKYDSMQVSSFMGIFPEINRVWMTIDNHLYLWNYEHMSADLEMEAQINTHEDPDQIIVHAAIVKPIPGVFLEQIEYVLVVSTPLEITLLGIAFAEKQKKNQPRGNLTIYQTEMSCHADNVNMSSIVGTRTGRIFMRGNDGQLFELLYQAEEGWLTRKVRKVSKSGGGLSVFIPSIFSRAGTDPIKTISLDDERNLLYTITKNNHIELISLGEDGTEFNRIAKISDLSNQLNRSFNSFDDSIISIHSLSLSESLYLHCVAITASGFKLYFTTSAHPQQYSLTDNRYVPPSVLELRFVLPPTGQSLVNQGAKIHESFYSHGITVASQALDEVDRILLFSPHAGVISRQAQKQMVEYTSFFDIEGRTWAIAEASSLYLQTLGGNKSSLGYALNELVTQFEYAPRRFYLLTNGGLTTISKLRPIDVLLNLITGGASGDARPFQEFFQSFGQDEACAMSLAIACSHSSISNTQYVVPQNTASFAGKLFFELGGSPVLRTHQPVSQAGGGPLGVPMSSVELYYSAKHNGLYLYTSRLLKNIWKRELVLVKKGPSENYLVFDTPLTIDLLVSVQGNLQALDRFLKQYPKFTAPPTPDARPTQGDHEAWKLEQQSFANIHELIRLSIEAIAFLSLLIDFRISNIAKSLSNSEKADLCGLTFEMLVVSGKGKEVAKALMTSLVNGQIAKELGVEGIISSLQQRCPSICESSDVILYKGMEHLRNAKSFINQGSFWQHLNDALQLFSSVTKHISMEKLKEIVNCFKSLRYYNGVIDLCLLKASEFRNEIDSASQSYLSDSAQYRYHCYQFIFETIEDIENLNGSNGRALEEKGRIKKAAISRALGSDDEEFHYALYSWFISQDWIEKLLEIQSRYLEEFLFKKSSDDLQIADYLCKFYVRNSRFFDAATLLHSLAYYPGLSLGDRLGYLTNAITHARSSTGANTQEILNRIQDEVDLARVQLDLATMLATIPEAQDIIPEVNEELMDAKRLFFLAKNFELHEVTLKVLFVSDRGGVDGKLMTLVEHSWTRIIENSIQSSANPLESLCDKIKELGRSFYPDETIFPLKFLISKLESLGFDDPATFGSMSPWVIRTLLDIRVPFARLFGVYQDLYDSKLPPWSGNKALVYLIQNLTYLLERWFEFIRSPSVNFYERDEFPARTVDEVLSKYLVNVPHSDTVLLDRLHAIQSRVRSTY